MQRQVGRVLAAVVVVGAVASGCGGGPSQVGAAAIVGPDAVALSTVQDRIAVALGPDKAQFVASLNQAVGGGFGPPEVARQVVTDAILHDLLVPRAAEEGIVVTEADVDAELASRGEDIEQTSMYTGQALRDEARDDLTAAQLGARYLDRLSITVDLVGFMTEPEALAASQVIAAGGPAADAVFTDAPQNLQGGRQSALASEIPSLASTYLFGTPIGSQIVVQPTEEGQPWTLYRIADRRTDLPPSEPSAVDQLAPEDLSQVGYRMLQEASTDVGVTVSPRYGVWDPILLRVVDETMTAGVIVPPAAPSLG